MKIETKFKESSEKNDKCFLSINGVDDTKSWCGVYSGGISGGLYNEKAISELLSHPFSSVENDVNSIHYRPDFDLEWIDGIDAEIIFKDSYSGKAPSIKFEFTVEWEEWAKPISIIEYASFLEDALSELSFPGVEYFQDEDFVTNGFGFIFTVIDIEETMCEVVSEYLIKIEELVSLSEKRVRESLSANSLSMFFNFPVAVRSACEQYLVYFIQFLSDIGIDATSEIKHETGKTLFSVTPRHGNEALGEIRDALNTYLKMPENLDVESNFHMNKDIAVRQLEANILHLRSQIILASATLEAKNETIEALKMTNFRLAEAINLKPPRSEEGEKMLGGILKFKSADFKGISIDLAEIIRRLKRKF